MDGGRLKHSCEQIIPESFNLHIFLTDQSEIDKHVQTDKQLDNAPGMLVLSDKQEGAQRNGQTNVAEIEQVEQIALCQP